MHQLQDGLHRVQKLARRGLLLQWCPNSFTVVDIPLEILKSERLKRNYTQEYVADKLGVSPSRISRWETRQIEMRTSESVSYAAAIGIDKSEFYALCASLASNQSEKPSPIAEFHMHCYSKDSVKQLIELTIKLGIEHIVIIETIRHK